MLCSQPSSGGGCCAASRVAVADAVPQFRNDCDTVGGAHGLRAKVRIAAAAAIPAAGWSTVPVRVAAVVADGHGLVVRAEIPRVVRRWRQRLCRSIAAATAIGERSWRRLERGSGRVWSGVRWNAGLPRLSAAAIATARIVETAAVPAATDTVAATVQRW
jgi:hypothetical protein